MKKIKIALKNIALLLVLIVSFNACDNDFDSVDTDVINNENATHFNTDSEKFAAITYTKKTDPVQTNGLPINYLGVYNDPFYGQMTAGLVTQVNSSLIDPTFGENVVLDSVVLTIPYFSRVVGLDEDNAVEYELDSVFGSDPFRLSIYESNFFLRDFNPNSDFDESQNYYSNGSASETEPINESELESTLIEVIDEFTNIDEFVPSNEQINLEDEEGEINQVLAPALRLVLDNEFWQEKILDKEGEIELSNSSNFNDYFRGLYFKAEPINGSGNMMLLNLASISANVTLFYTKDPFTEGADREQATYTLTFSGKKINILSNTFNFPLVDGDENLGDEQLFLKGGEGSVAVINLFNGDDEGNSIELDELRDSYRDSETNTSLRLINEANIVFYVDQTAAQNLDEPDRVYIYDLDNNIPLVDFFLDRSDNNFPNQSIINHLGILQREDNEPNGQGIKYKIKLTQHIRNIIFNDSTNVKLGLAVSSNVNLEGNSPQFDVLSNNDDDKIPLSTIVTPRGTILHGNRSPLVDKRVFLEIFYTEPDN